jgi:hypothetical protein
LKSQLSGLRSMDSASRKRNVSDGDSGFDSALR